MKSFFLSAVLVLCLYSFASATRHDTSFSFSTLETAHFSIHFHQGLEAVAQKSAVIAEEVHGKLVKEFCLATG